MIPHDYHLHSSFSCDCQAPMADMCRAAIALGIPEIGFTEHYDLHAGESDNCRDAFRLEAWSAELERCQAEFAGRLILRAGVELGEPHLFAAEAQALLARYPFDYALGSLHWVGSASIFDLTYFQEHSAADAFHLYFEELEHVTRAGGFDILSHLDVPTRAAFAVYGRYDPAEHEDYIRPVLRNCVERGLALDINTASLRRRAEVLNPGLEILRWYVELGGERITLGSDAHRPSQVGGYLETALATARAAGLKHLTFYERRQPRLAPLPEP
ncbi:MAG: histidinol-phosphatase HisJ family protein [Anaerolineales bacterium]|nr:histidinol-phosphatase HisJ family protein [Anaerolineales bacterium]